MRDSAGELANNLKFLQMTHLQFDPFVLSTKLGLLKLPSNRWSQTLQLALHDIVMRAISHGFHGDILADSAGDEYERDPSLQLLHDSERRRTAKTGHRVIRYDDVPALRNQAVPQAGSVL